MTAADNLQPLQFRQDLSRGRWRQHAQPLPAEHVQGGQVNWKAVPGGVYAVPTHLLSVEDPGRVRRKTGSAVERSIAAKGMMNPVHIGVSEQGFFGLSDGNHRLQAAKNLGLPTVPARFVNLGLR